MQTTTRKELALHTLVVLLLGVFLGTLLTLAATYFFVIRPSNTSGTLSCKYRDGNVFDMFGLDGVQGMDPQYQDRTYAGYCTVNVTFTSTQSPSVAAVSSDCPSCFVAVEFQSQSGDRLIFITPTRVALDPIMVNGVQLVADKVMLAYPAKLWDSSLGSPDPSAVRSLFDTKTTPDGAVAYLVQSGFNTPLPGIPDYSSLRDAAAATLAS